ncbi:dihydroxyacetone kinase phosphotransfer subunit [Salinibacterium sp. CAN_S4]|uniref:dihydroxyacetone kinase phosphoryl donor subunit DhaM n=1 Tax=Salinibacterium sp. CAN_S4 TaxID=2787727 RepID=UPI0018EFDD62
MIGIVVVSHSPALARSAVDLALEMVGESPPPIAIAAGAGDGIIGTDATRVADAIDEVASAEGVLVFMDLGSAVLSATMALEFMATTEEVRLSDAPFVEGIVAAVVLAAAGASLDEVDGESRAAMDAKRGQLDRQPAAVHVKPVEAVIENSGIDVTLVNPDGLHSRPAAAIVKAMAAFEATLTIANATTGKGPVAANSLIGILSLGANTGDVIRISGTGPQAAEAVEALGAMAVDGFGELPDTRIGA